MDGGRRMTRVSTVTSPASSGAGSMRAPGYRNPSDPLGYDSLASARFSRIFNLILIKDRTPWRAMVSARFRHERCQGLSRGKIGVTEISSMLAPTHAPDMSKLQPSTIEDYEPHTAGTSAVGRPTANSKSSLTPSVLQRKPRQGKACTHKSPSRVRFRGARLT